MPATDKQTKPNEWVSRQSGFSPHAGVACKATQRKKLERLCRYITRPAIAEQRLSLASNGNVIIGLKTPYDDGTTHVVLSPLEFIGRLAALVPGPRVNLTRFHGVFSRGGLPPNSKLRKYVVLQHPSEPEERPKPKAYSMTWRVSNGCLLEKCEKCGGPVRVIARLKTPMSSSRSSLTWV